MRPRILGLHARALHSEGSALQHGASVGLHPVRPVLESSPLVAVLELSPMLVASILPADSSVFGNCIWRRPAGVQVARRCCHRSLFSMK